MENQKKVWDRIAPDWHSLKTRPNEDAQKFLRKKSGKMLDFGSGSGRNLLGLNVKEKIYLVDFSKEMLRLAKSRAKKENLDVETRVSFLWKTPFEDNYFDAALFIAVLHCIPDPKKRKESVEELFRIMKSKGEVFVSVWNKDSDWFKNKPKEKFIAWKDKGIRYYYLYEPQEVYSLFKKCGFKISKRFVPYRNIDFIVRKP